MPSPYRAGLALVALVACVALGCSASPTEDPAATLAPADPPASTVPREQDLGCESFVADLQSRLDATRGKQRVQHAALAVATSRCGKSVLFSDDPKAAVKATPESLWQIGSITKTFIAAAVLNVVETGKLSLDDGLVKYLPDFPSAEKITIRHLLSHTSGLFDYLAAEELQKKSPGEKLSVDDILAIAAKAPLDFEPGTSWGYSNTNFVVLGRVLERVTGAPLGSLVRVHATLRAKLGHTFFASAETAAGTLVPGFDSGIDVTRRYDPSWWGAAGAMQATAGDVLDWTVALLDSDVVLSPSSKTAMLTTVRTDRRGYRYGLGVVERDAATTHGNGTAYGHFGTVPGYQSVTWFHPTTKVAVVAIVSDSEGKPEDLVATTYAALRALE